MKKEFLKSLSTKKEVEYISVNCYKVEVLIDKIFYESHIKFFIDYLLKCNTRFLTDDVMDKEGKLFKRLHFIPKSTDSLNLIVNHFQLKQEKCEKVIKLYVNSILLDLNK